MGNPSISAESGVTPKHRYDASVNESKTLVFEGRGNLYRSVVENNHTSAVYVQFYDAASTGDVTVGTDIVMEFRIAASSATGIDGGGGQPLRFFSKGCVMAVVSARGGSGAPGAAASANSWWFNRKSFG